MRVLLISHTCQSRTEGQPRVKWLVREPGVEIQVLVPDRWKHYGNWRGAFVPGEERYRVRVGRVAWPWAGPAQFYLHWYPGLARIIREYRPDIIDLWEEPWSLVSAQACKMRRMLMPNCRIISETEQNVNKVLPPPFEQFRRYTLANSDFTIGRSEEAIRVLRAKGYSGPAEVVPNGVDSGLFRPMNRDRCRRELCLNQYTIGYIGRLVEEKGTEDIIEALVHCRANIQVLFVGSGPMKETLEKRAAELGKSDSVRFLPEQPLEMLPAIMNAIDVLVLPSRTTPRWKEQFGRVIIEAHACGTPVIGSDSGAIPDVIGQGGIVVPEQDAKALARAIESLWQMPDRGVAMGCLGLKRVLSEATWERIAKRMVSIYRRVL